MSDTLLCHKCGKILTSGEGNFYVIRIEAVADPSPPNLSSEDLDIDFEGQFRRVFDEARDMSERDLLDQVFRRLTVHLCRRCYDVWIEDPTA